MHKGPEAITAGHHHEGIKGHVYTPKKKKRKGLFDTFDFMG
jgi:hypothetical protein